MLLRCVRGVSPASWRAALAGGSVVVLTVLAFLPILLWGGWVWDDLYYVRWNPRLVGGEGLYALWFEPGKPADALGRSLAERDVYWWPLLYSSLWLERWLWGEFCATKFHATNIAIHSLNVWLVWALLRRFEVPGAWVIALVFAIHPGQMMAPALVMGRKEMLASACVLLAVWVWFPRGGEQGAVSWWRVGSVCLLVVVGSLFKTQAVIIPAAVVIVHWWRAGRLTRAVWLRLVPVAGVSVMVAGLAWYMFAVVSYSNFHDFSLPERIMIAARSVWLHGFLSLAPVESAVRFWRWKVSVADPLGWLALAACVGGLVILWRTAPKSRSPLAAAVWFVVCMSPTLGVVDHHAMGLSFAFSRHRYLASIASIALVVGLVYAWLRAHGSAAMQAAGRLAAAALIVACLVADLRSSFAFASSSAWWTRMARYQPEWDWLQSTLVWALSAEGRHEEALEIARRNVDSDPLSLRFRRDLGFAYALAEDPGNAMRHYQVVADALEADPSLMRRTSRLRRREHLWKMPLDQREVSYLRFGYERLLRCAGKEAEAAHQRRLAQRLYPHVDFDQVYTNDTAHSCRGPW